MNIRYMAFSNIMCENKKDADLILDGLNSNIIKYGVASVFDFYDIIGGIGKDMDVRYGWDRIIPPVIKQNSDGVYKLTLPDPICLDKFRITQIDKARENIIFTVPYEDAWFTECIACSKGVLLKSYIDKIGSCIDYAGEKRKVVSVKVTEKTIYIELE
ncbi:MAG: hypothetical protein K0S61_81 [Anaerocolumna sp.]|jgi:hypothetical protein|nr:hypothetical protein [Anaerocolumna sp.]